MSAETVPTLRDAEKEFRTALTDDQANEALRKDYFLVLTDCSQALSRFESEGQRRSRLAQSLAFGGLLAGAVAVPALTAASAMGNAAWTAGLAGFAGATNTAQHWIQQSGLSYVESLRTREQIRNEFKSAIEDFLASDDVNKRRQSLFRAKAACVLYAVSIPNVKLIEEAPTGATGGDASQGQQPGGDSQSQPSQEPPAAQPAEPPEEMSPQEPPTNSEEKPPEEPAATPSEAAGH